MNRPDLAIFLATSGHSGVDRIMKNLVPTLASHGTRIDLLQIRNHGPYWDTLPEGVRSIPLGTRSVYTSLPGLVRYLRKSRPHVLLSDKYRVNRVAILARRLAGVPVRLGVRTGTTVSKDLERRGAFDRRFEYSFIRRFYPWADCLITPSQGAAEDLARIAGLPSERITVIPNPVVDGKLLQSAEEAVDHPWFECGDIPVILGVGELSARKDFATLVRAFARLRRARPCRLMILGKGKQREKLLTLADELGVAEDMELLGFRQNPYPYMRRAKEFVLTSVCEGMPTVLIEALALGTPVVSTDCPSGPREILQDDRYGPLVPVGDVEALAEAMAGTLDNPPPAEFLRGAVEDYTVVNSSRAYLRALELKPT